MYIKFSETEKWYPIATWCRYSDELSQILFLPFIMTVCFRKPVEQKSAVSLMLQYLYNRSNNIFWEKQCF